jgi:DNA-binding transcriptional regulator YhcF (GntR family)
MFVSHPFASYWQTKDVKSTVWSFPSFYGTIWGRAREKVSQEAKEKLANDIQLIIKKSAAIGLEKDADTKDIQKRSLIYNLVWFPIKVLSWLQSKKESKANAGTFATATPQIVKPKKVSASKTISEQQIPTQLLKYHIPEHQRQFVGAQDMDLSHIHVYSSGQVSERLSFSFGACDWQVFYELGVASALSQLIKPEILRDAVYLGSSTGSVVALALALQLDMERVKEALTQLYEKQNRLFQFSSTSGVLDTVLKQLVPTDVSMARDRLLISLSKDSNFQHVFAQLFDSKQVNHSDLGSSRRSIGIMSYSFTLPITDNV